MQIEGLETRCLLTVNEFPSPTLNSFPDYLTAGPDGNVWFTENQADNVGRITPAGVITEFPIPTRNASLTGISAGPDGALWFTESQANKIGRLAPADGSVQEFSLPTAGSGPTQITAGPDGCLWFIEANVGQIAKLDPSTGQVSEFRARYVNFSMGLTFGPDGELWFALGPVNALGRMTPDGSQVTAYVVPTPRSVPTGIAVGPDGNIWFTEHAANQVGRLDPNDGSVREFTIPTLGSGPEQIAVGADGNLWFTETAGNKIGRITPAGTIVDEPIPTSATAPRGIVLGPDGNLWFTEYTGNAIGQVLVTTPATHFLVTLPGSSRAGDPFEFTVTALDAANQIVPDYTGTVHFASSDPYPGLLPTDYTFTLSDQGSHTFTGVTLFTAGLQTLTVEESLPGALTVTSAISILPSAANHFVLAAPATAGAGLAFDVVVTAVDPYGNVDRNYQGTIAFTTSDPDPGVRLPANYTFGADDTVPGGMHAFLDGVTLLTPGDQSLTVTDAASEITETLLITVLPAPPPPPGGGAKRPPPAPASTTRGPAGDALAGQWFQLRDSFVPSIEDHSLAAMPRRRDRHALQSELLGRAGLPSWHSTCTWEFGD